MAYESASLETPEAVALLVVAGELGSVVLWQVTGDARWLWLLAVQPAVLVAAFGVGEVRVRRLGRRRLERCRLGR